MGHYWAGLALIAAVVSSGAGCFFDRKATPPVAAPPIAEETPIKPPVEEMPRVKPEKVGLAGERDAMKSLEPLGAKFEFGDKGEVRRIVLEGPKVTDAALDDVIKFTELRQLSLARASVSDAGMLKLSQNMTWLVNLGITDTKVTDEGLQHLTKITTLQNVWVCENDKLTAAGIAAFKAPYPQINVHIMNKKAKKDKK